MHASAPFAFRARSPFRVGLAAAAALLFAGLAAPTTVAASEFSAKQKSEIEKTVHDYLLANPDVIKDAIDLLEKRQKDAESTRREKVLTEQADKLLRSRNQAVVGNPDGDVTLVEFFDYNCGYCKQSLNTVAKLIEGDPKLRVVLKDFAILGTDSVETAQVATAIRNQFSGPKFWDFHRKLLSTRGHIGKQQALAAARELGADMGRLEKDMEKPDVQESLREVATLADQLRFDGTPAWVIGNEAVVGGLPMTALKSKIDNLRKCGKTAC